MTKVTLSHLSKTYDRQTTPSLREVSLDIASGELVALLGPSGCGKTTTMKLIAGLLQPTTGDVRFDGQSILHQKPEHRQAVMVFQNHLLFPFMSVEDNIGFGLKMRGVGKREIAKRVAGMLEQVQLPDLGKRRPFELSGGQQQRVALARALIIQPKVLLLDEPLSNLDAHLRLEMRDLIQSLQKRLGITTLFVTHDQDEAVALADRIALLREGSLQQFGAPEDFYRRPADINVARFFGGRNFISGQSDGTVFISALGKLQLPKGASVGQGHLTIRPENIGLGKATMNTLQATVLQSQFLGTQTKLKLQIGETLLEASVNPEKAQSLKPGDKLSIHLPPHHLWVLT
jgi:ABC-type Fe3+/spermidine/putrescine transport system ATPase subunit